MGEMMRGMKITIHQVGTGWLKITPITSTKEITNGPYTISQAIVDMLLDNKLSFENDVKKIEVEIV